MAAATDKQPKGKDQGSFEIGLKDVVHGQVVTRFPPEPSGYLHIGHAKAALLNDYFAKTYEGKLIVRFDDTNPSKEKVEFEESIKEDLLLLGIKADQITYTSDSFDKLYEYALQMIKEGNAYVDDTDVDTMRAERMQQDGIESKSRNLSIEENLKRFEEMKNGTEFGLKCCLRAKIDMKNKNKCLRDPVLYRCNIAVPHHRTGNKWKIYPIYDFACPIVDSLEGVTHALRTNEYRDRNPQYEWILNALKLRQVHIWDFSRLNFVYTLLSKRKLTWFVDEGLVTGWDDPRFPTVRGIRRRGMTIDALRQYILMQGASQKNLELEWDKIWALNKKIIDPVAPRHTALDSDKITSVKIVGDEVKTEIKEMPKHKKNPDVGNKLTTFSSELYLAFEDAKTLEVGEKVTFMDWGNFNVEKIQWAADKSHIVLIEVKINPDLDYKGTKKITWLSRAETGKDESTPVKVTLFDYDYLITKKKLEETDDVKNFVTPVTEFKTDAICDANLRSVKKGDIIQLERKGYYICDKQFDASKPTEPIHLIFIPDGKALSMQSKADDKQQDAGKTEKGGREKKSKESKKQAKADKANGSSGKMYKVNPVYTENLNLDPSKISKMYVVDNVYGIQDKDIPAVQEGPVTSLPNTDKAPAPEKEKVKKAKAPKAAPAAAAPEGPQISKLDICVGKILSVKRHPDADTLYVEQIDVGEAEPREVVSGLVKYMTEDEMTGKLILVLKNLKPQAMRGIKSYAMVLCASGDDHSKVEFLVPPEGSVPGDKVYFEGHEGEPEALLNPKKKVWESLQPDFTSGADLVATWKGLPFRTAKGVVKAASIVNAEIK
ncbi:tRNA synthetases class I, catalytic domain-containing protein [Powellomyces hirtus]|nr:tRNA synthetases class I, catalytic domain-containing protein [Powellomyces hirtus]